MVSSPDSRHLRWGEQVYGPRNGRARTLSPTLTYTNAIVIDRQAPQAVLEEAGGEEEREVEADEQVLRGGPCADCQLDAKKGNNASDY